MVMAALINLLYPIYMFPVYVDEPDPMVSIETVEHEPKIEWMDFIATAYVSDCDGCIGITKSGYDVRNTIYSPNGHRVIAVDPDVIPLGSLVEIEANGEIFTAKALDIGSAIKSRKIDLLVNSEDEAFEWGVKEIRLRVIK